MLCNSMVIKPMPEECVLSYILRINMVLGPGRMPNVFNEKGKWSEYLMLPERYQGIFINNFDSQVFNLLLDSGFIEYQADILKSPTSYTIFMGAFLKGQKVKRSSSPQVKYCSKCIVDSIKKNGFAYFKADWASWMSGDNCRLHKEAFHVIKAGNRKDTIKAVELVMIGKRSKFCKSLRDLPYYREVSDDLYYSKASMLNEPHLAPCLVNKLKMWLLYENHIFPDSIVEALGSASHDSLVRSMESHIFRDYMFKKAYYALHDSSYLKFHEFWQRCSKLHTFYCGVIEKQGLNETVFKAQGANCSKCHDVDCSANILIIKPRQHLFSSFQGYRCCGEQML
ncbi:hypothetical protein OAA_02320 [Vibrio cyclitrophicus 1F175]|uniref:hypothetical protein n=2 Tax=Vibrio cyclitrophicus TaxID=47951 RepID=UPI0002D9B774|nr:hypothetical protein [Vibrio cyclitrophicus]OEF32245.1 hypothetical protein OA7_17080 [Vibrio cyclitrophicus 1F53]OEF65604.1 hypothetical protein OAA_02320 [Vibrio cyclitrophicus 1F175]PMH25593.1 hypothetical protein BCU72_04885 [Vibrio cyclitrophicus]PMH82646.1 hypothetical protein BCU60_01685 [Vibrio cyclitrophicus]